MKKYGVPLVVVVIGSLFLYIINTYVQLVFKSQVMTVLTSFVLFLFGFYLNGAKRGRSGALRRVIVIILYLALLVVQTGLINLNFLEIVLSEIGATSVVFYMLYFYFGYIYG